MTMTKYIANRKWNALRIEMDDIVEIVEETESTVTFKGDKQGRMSLLSFHLVFKAIEPTGIESAVKRQLKTIKEPTYDIGSPKLDMDIDDYMQRGRSTTVYGPMGFRVQLVTFEEQHIRTFIQAQVDKALREHGIEPEGVTR